MKIKFYSLVFIIVAMLTAGGCKKNNVDDTTPVDTTITTTQVLTDFANVLVNPNYQAIYDKATLLRQSAQNLTANTTAANLTNAQNAWRAVRVPWEQAEGYLFGPIEDFNYDPAIDTWPVNTVELDSLLSGITPLTLSYIESLPYSLKGFHPIEFVLFGVGGNKTAAQLTTRELEYLNSLTQSLLNSATSLKNSWEVSQGNFTNEFITAGNGSTRYATRKDALLAIVIAMENICNEVANGKMEDPLVAHDSTLAESQYAHNATNDFKNNIIGVQNAYMCKFNTTGRSLHNLVVDGDNLLLDNAIQQQINAAISAIETIDPDYGLAIFTQHSQIIMAQSAINDLGSVLTQLHNFVETKITD